MLKYIENLSKEGGIFFLTTHSNVMLDNFQKNNEVNALHVVKNNGEISIVNTTNSIQKNDILNDLGIKASDILQSNGVIWVEGPSDRIYMNKWIELWSDGKFKEGKDYQCVFYGGRLLNNLTFDEEEDLINLLKVNRNSIILIDSDKENGPASLNDTKKRICEEASKNKIMCWITKGREIENYVSKNTIDSKLEIAGPNVLFNQYDNIEDYLDKLENGLGKKFLKDKIGYAKIFTTDVKKEDYEHNLDLDEQMKNVISAITKWNT